jgi:hypothetical protein
MRFAAYSSKNRLREKISEKFREEASWGKYRIGMGYSRY